jgi:putative transposase
MPLSKKDYDLFLTTLQEACNLFQVTVYAYCLMPNHYHLLVCTPSANLSRFMRHLNGVYTQRFNREHKRDGPLFRGRFKSILVQEDSYLIEVVRYIHKNPLKAKKGVKSFLDYKLAFCLNLTHESTFTH